MSLEKAIEVLLLPHAELVTNIEQELQDNPLLEAEIDDKQIEALANLPSTNNMSTSTNDGENQEFESSGTVNMMTLEEHLYHQLSWEFSDPQKRKIGEYIIGNLDKDGFLGLTCEEIAENFDLSDISAIQEILYAIQNFDPIGIATKDLNECLTVQLGARQSPYRDLAIRIVKEYLDHLGEKRYACLAKKLSVSTEEITEAAALIASLEPRPSRNYLPATPCIYVEPDIYMRKNEEGKLIVETNRSGLPVLKISRNYRDLLNQPNLSPKDRDFIKERINKATQFIRNIHQRGETITAIAKFILENQKDFFEGDASALNPMTLKDVASYLERNESTISRAINKKYIDTPQGLFPLKFFFSHSVAREGNEDTSAHNVIQELAQLIEEENKQSPLSDQEIQDYFNAKGLHLARRTVTKYRQKLNIPSSHLRK